MRLNHRATEQLDSPIAATYALLAGRSRRQPLLDLAQAAPAHPPAPAVVAHVGAVARDPAASQYVELPGLPRLREAIADDLSHAYQARIGAEHVQVTAGSNQAFCVAASVLAGPGDQILLLLPYFFNHDMWLRLQGIEPVYGEPGPGLVPSVATAAAAITPRTRAIVLVTPGNPSGVTADPATIADFARLAAEHRIALILDETYRCFRGTDAPAHDLFNDPRWPDTVISLHSFSKDLAIPGYRVGAIVADPVLNREARKLLDCLAICAPRIGQEAAWAGLRHAAAWRRDRAREVADRWRWFQTMMAGSPGGFELLSSGGYFGWVRHPFPDRPTAAVVRDLAVTHDTLVMPGTAFLPDDRRTIRISFANLDPAGIDALGRRLRAAGGPRS